MQICGVQEKRGHKSAGVRRKGVINLRGSGEKGDSENYKVGTLGFLVGIWFWIDSDPLRRTYLNES